MMLHPRWLATFTLCLVLAAGCESSSSDSGYGDIGDIGDTHTAFNSAAGRFSIQTPGPMQESQQQVQTEAGAVELYMFLYEKSASEAYIASYSDYDSGLTALADPEDILDGSRDGAVGNMGGILDSESRISIQDPAGNAHPGRDLVISAVVEGRSVSARMRIFLVNNRLYQVMGLEESDTGVSPAIVAYLDSFKLTR